MQPDIEKILTDIINGTGKWYIERLNVPVSLYDDAPEVYRRVIEHGKILRKKFYRLAFMDSHFDKKCGLDITFVFCKL